MTIPPLLLIVLCFTVIFFGGAHVWVQAILIVTVFLLTGVGLVTAIWRRIRTGSRPLVILKEPIQFIGLLFFLWTAFSLWPLSAGTMKWLSPKSWEVWDSVRLVGGQFPHSLSLYPFITVNSGIFALAVFLFYGLALYGIRSPGQVHGLVMGILLLGTLESLYALVQLATAQPYILWWKKTISETVSTGTFIDRNHLAGFLSMTICLGVGYLWTLGRDPGSRGQTRGHSSGVDRFGIPLSSLGTRGIVLLSALALMLAALLTTASRGGTLTLAIGLVFMVGLLGIRFFKSRKAAFFLLALTLVCSYVTYVAMDRVWERFQTFEFSFEDRLAIARDTYHMAVDFPVTGIGLGVFEFVFPRYQSFRPEVFLDYAHNDWVQLWAETGVVGLVFLGGGFLWFMGRSILLWRNRRDPMSVGLGLGGLGAVAVMAVHSLSEFNLHMPANVLLLALIAAITTLVLHWKGGPEGREGLSPCWTLKKVPWGVGAPLVFLLVLVTGASAIRTLQVWRADSLARTVWNSTLPFKEPSDRDLIKAWSLAPGNAVYWQWMASRMGDQRIRGDFPGGPITQGGKDRKLTLLSEGIRKNPTAWALWRDLAWTAFRRTSRDPAYYFPLAQQAIFQSALLHPYVAQGYFESGLIGLASWADRDRKAPKTPWKEAFARALDINPALSPSVVDQVLLYADSGGGGDIKGLLPKKTEPYLLTAVHLLKRGQYREGLDILSQGEHYREQEIRGLEEGILKDQGTAPEKRISCLNRILALDPESPVALLGSGKVLEALRSQDRRGGDLRNLADSQALALALKSLEEQQPARLGETAYFLGRLAEEEGDLKMARFQYQRALQANPQFFPVWLHLRSLLSKSGPSDREPVDGETMERKIRLLEMDQVVGDAWVFEGRGPGEMRWKAAYRTGKRPEKVEIAFGGEIEGGWKLLLDGRFVSAWAGKAYQGEKKLTIPPGEHEFALVVYHNSTLKGTPGKLPFKLSLSFN